MSISSSKFTTVRAAAILTNSGVGTTPVSVSQSLSQRVAFLIDFTIGSLTNVILKPQKSLDGTNWYDMVDPGTLTLTASGAKEMSVDGTGAKLVRLLATGTGTATSSSLTVQAGWQRS